MRNHALVIAAFVLLGGWGYWALVTTPIDAIPDLSDNQVIVFTDWPGRSPQEVEGQITYPLEPAGLARVHVVRSSSAFGFSMINVIFGDAVDLYFARSRVLERLNLLSKALPQGVVPTLGPDATGVGHVFWYTVEGTGTPARPARDPGLVRPLSEDSQHHRANRDRAPGDQHEPRHDHWRQEPVLPSARTAVGHIGGGGRRGCRRW